MEQPGRVAQMVPEPAPAAISATSETRDAEALWTETQCDDPQLHAVRFLLRALSGEVDVASVARVLSLRGDLSALVALSVDPAYSAAVTALVGALAAAGEEAVLEEVELAVLEKAGVAANAEVLARKAVRCRTARFYTQRKFNLFREESEGFAKLLVALQSGTGRGLKELVGAFGLDPNRVLDLLLDIAEMRKLEGRNEIEDVDWHDFSASSIANILGFKISNASEGQEWIGFVKVAAMLLKANVIELNQIYTHVRIHQKGKAILDFIC